MDTDRAVFYNSLQEWMLDNKEKVREMINDVVDAYRRLEEELEEAQWEDIEDEEDWADYHDDFKRWAIDRVATNPSNT